MAMAFLRRAPRAPNAVAEQFNFKQLEDLFAAAAPARAAPRALWVIRSSKSWTPSLEEQLTKAEAIAERS